MLLICCAAPATAQWRVEQAQVHSGAEASSSDQLALQGCVSHDPAGLASSASYTVYAGCGAAAVILPGEGDPNGPPGPEPPGPPPIPGLDPVGTLLLCALLGAAGAAFLRRA